MNNSDSVGFSRMHSRRLQMKMRMCSSERLAISCKSKKTKKIDNFMVPGSHYEFSVTWDFWSQVTDLSNLGTMVPGDRIFLFFEPGTFWSQVTAYHPILAGFGRPNLKTWLTEKLHKNFLPDNFGLSAGFFEHFFMLDRRIAAWSFR